MSAVDIEWMAVNRMFKTVRASLANSRLEESVDFFQKRPPLVRFCSPHNFSVAKIRKTPMPVNDRICYHMAVNQCTKKAFGKLVSELVKAGSGRS